ncbi:histamine H2 receptor-like [Oculina patagonica]
MAENATSWNVTNENSTSAPGPGPGGRGPPPAPEMTTEDIVADVFFCILAVMIVFGNSLVIGAFRVNRRLRTTTNLLLMSLAVADMLIGTISLPLWVYISITYTFIGPVYNFYLIFDVICGVSSILNLTAISLERCYALLAPIKHRNIRKRVVLAIIFVAWVLSILAGAQVEFLDVNNKKYYGVIVTVAFFFVPLAVILGAYGTIFHIARAHARARGSSSFKKDLRIATTVAVVIGLFVICWTPFFALNFAFSVCGQLMWMTPGCQGLMKLPPVILKINKWLQYGNSVCNPIIYGLRNKDFRRAFRKILLGMCCKKVPISDYSKSAYGRTVRNAHLQRESSFENSRSVIYPPQLPTGMFDMRQSYRKAIQSGRNKPIKLKFTKKSLADGLLALNVDAFHSLAWGDFTSTTQLTSSSDATASPAELCNPGFEYDQTETGIYPIDQATQKQDFNDNVSGSNNSLHKSSPKASMQNGKVRVHFTPLNSREKDDEEEEAKNVSSLAPFDRKRSLSEIFIRPSSETDSLKQKLRSSFS